MTPQAAIGSSSVELWDRVARLYDLQLWLDRPALRVAIALAGPRSDDHVLDVGTGTGALLRELAASGVRAEKVVGVDASTRMLERARSSELPGEWRLEQADARQLPFGDESSSLVFATYLLNVLSDEDATAVLREVHRVLVPGGRLVVVSPVAPWSRASRGRPTGGWRSSCLGCCPGSVPAFASSTPSRSFAPRACSRSSVDTWAAAIRLCVCSPFAMLRRSAPPRQRAVLTASRRTQPRRVWTVARA